MTAQSPSLGSLPEVRRLFSEALQALMQEVPAERGIILFGDKDDRDLAPRAASGLELEGFWQNAPLSLSLLRQVRNDGVPLLTGDAQVDSNGTTSLILSEIRSLLCLPFWGPSGRVCGLMYADTRSSVGTFTKQHLNQALKLVRQLEEQLEVVRAGGQAGTIRATRAARTPTPAQLAWAAEPAPTPSRRAPTLPAHPPPVEVPSGPILNLRPPSGRAQALFFRCLATMFQAGVPLSRSLWVLSGQSEDARMGKASRELSQRVQSGHRLCQAMQATGAFSPFQIHMVAVGERTGKLPEILMLIASHQESADRDRLRLKSALAYPAFVLAGSLVLLVVGPGYLLAGQFQLLRELGVPLPFLTRILSGLSDLLRNPAFLMGACVTALLLTVGARVLWSRPGFRAWLTRRMLSWPVAGRIYQTLALARFVRGLAIQVEAGISLTEALPLAAATSGHPGLQETMAGAVESLVSGSTLAGCLGSTGHCPRALLEMLQVGEESGQVAGMLRWLAGFYDEEAGASLAAFTALLEPFVMLVMGIVAAVIMLATMLPMVQALQAL